MKKKKIIKNLKRENIRITNSLIEQVLENIRLVEVLKSKKNPIINYEIKKE